MRFCTRIEIVRIPIADRFAQALQPQACPSKFDAQDRKTNGNHDDRGARRYDHDEPDRQNGRAHNADNDAPGGLVG